MPRRRLAGGLARRWPARSGIPAGVSTLLAVSVGALTNVVTSGWSWPVGSGLAALVFTWAGLEAWRSTREGHRPPAGSGRSVRGGPGRLQRRSLAPPAGLLPPQVHGRDTLLDTLHALVETPDGRAHVLCGLGGCGKTTVALSAAQAAVAGGSRVWWITARDETSLITDLLELVMDLAATSAEIRHARTGMRSLTDLVWRRLEALPSRWLLVVDNADEPDLLAADEGRVGDGNGMVRGSSRGLVLVTSRAGGPQLWGGQAVLHPVGPLDDRDGGQVLCDLAPDAGKADDAAVLAGRLGGLPLALRAAGRYLGSTSARLDQVTTFAAYRQALDARSAALLRNTIGSAPREVLATTWELSLDLLSGQGLPQARALMRLVGGFAPAPIPVGVFDGPALFNSPVFIRGATDGPGFQRVAVGALAPVRTRLGGRGRYGQDVHRRSVAALCDLGLLELTGGAAAPGSPASLVAHPLVTEVNAAWLANRRPLARAVHATVAALLSRAARSCDPYDPSTYGWWPSLAPHLIHVLTDGIPHLSRTDVAALVDAANATALGMTRGGDPLAGHGLAVVAADMGAHWLGSRHPSYLEARHCIAKTLMERGLYRQAEAEFRVLLAMREDVLGVDHPDTLLSRNFHADSLMRQGLHGEAEAELRTVVSACERVLGAEHRWTLNTRHNLADVLGRQGLHRQAEVEFRSVLDVQRRALGAEDNATLHVLHHLADTLLQQGMYEQAEEECRAALPTLERVLGAEHYDTLRLRQHLAEVLTRRGRQEQAETEYQAVLAARERVLGTHHPDTVDTRAAIEQLGSMSSSPDGR
jgi:tetratricopeptide (TPR) repeat protein